MLLEMVRLNMYLYLEVEEEVLEIITGQILILGLVAAEVVVDLELMFQVLHYQ